jgi:hypothetical protein
VDSFDDFASGNVVKHWVRTAANTSLHPSVVMMNGLPLNCRLFKAGSEVSNCFSLRNVHVCLAFQMLCSRCECIVH